MLSISLFTKSEGLDDTDPHAEIEAIRGSLIAGSDAIPEGKRFEVIAQVR